LYFGEDILIMKRLASFLRLGLLFVLLAGTIFQPQSTVFAAGLSVTPITWDVIGLDSNNPSVGPNHFPVGVRVCNTSGSAATDVRASFVWDASNTYINLRDGTAGSGTGGARNYLPATGTLDLAAGTCTDIYFEVEVTRTSAAYGAKARYHIDVTANGGLSGSSPTRELYVEHLISQSRNYVRDVKLDGVSVPAGGTMTLMVGQTYNITINGTTATQGYNQLEEFINFPNTIFQVLSVSTSYSANNSPYTQLNMLYGDACKWDADLTSPTYLSCIGGDYKNGGSVDITYTVKILKVPTAPLVNPEPLQTLIYDFSGSSYHYNADYGVSTRFANIVNANITKSFSPKTIKPGESATMTFTLTNPGPAAVSGYTFSDNLATSGLALITTPTPAVAYSAGCGGTPSPAAGNLSPGATSLSFSGITVQGNGTCTITVNGVTGPASATPHTNTTGNLFINNTEDTGNKGSDVLLVTSLPAPPPSCPSPQTIATWNMSNVGTGNPVASSKNSDVTYANGTAVNIIGTGSGQGTNPNQTTSWYLTSAYSTTADVNPLLTATPTAPYFMFEIDTSNYGGITMDFSHLEYPNNDWGGTNDVWTAASTDNGATWYSPQTAPVGLAANIGGASNALVSVTNIASFDSTNPPTSSTKTIFRITTTAMKGTGGTVVATMAVDNVIIKGCPRPALPQLTTKSFTPPTIAAGASSVLTLVMQNPGASALTNVSVDDTFPTGMTLQNTTFTFTPAACGTVTKTNGAASAAGDGAVRFAAAILAAGASCQVQMNVTALTAGVYNNTTDPITSQYTGPNTTTDGYKSSTLTAIAPPVIAKVFGANSILSSGTTNRTTTLTFSIRNPNQSTALTGVAFTAADNLSTQLQVASPNGLIGPTCTSGTLGGIITATAGTSSVNLTGGTLDAGATCTFSINVIGVADGVKTNSVTVTSTNGGTGNTSTANILVKTPEPKINLLKQVGSSATGPWTSFLAINPGIPATYPQTVYFKFTVENTGDVPLTNVSITDVTIPSLDLSNCSTALIGGLALYETKTCVSGSVNVTVAGTYLNTAYATGDTANSPNSTARYATTGLTLVKNVTEAYFTAASQTLHYSYIVRNTGFAPLAGPVTVTDDHIIGAISCQAISAATLTVGGGSGNGDNWLDPGEQVYCPGPTSADTVTYTTTTDDVINKHVTNIAYGTANISYVSTDQVNSPNTSKIVPLAPDLTVSKTNSITGDTTNGSIIYGNPGSFTWNLTVSNSASAGPASFTNGQVILTDDLPSTGATYSVGTVTYTGTTGTVSCSIAANTLTCSASGAVTIPSGGSFNVPVTVTPTAAGTLINPRSAGICKVDPTTPPVTGLIVELNDNNNDCNANSVTVLTSLTLRKAWVNAIVNNAVGITATRDGTPIDTFASTANTATETDTNTTPVGVSAGDVITLAETFTPPASASNYSIALTCTGNTDALSGNQLTINAADTAIVCTYTNTRIDASLVIQKTWSNAVVGDTSALSTTGLTNNASLNSTANAANETDAATAVTVYAGETATISELLGVGNSSTYSANLACSNNAGTFTYTAGDTSGTLAIVGGDSGNTITCTFTNTRNTAPQLTLTKTANVTSFVVGVPASYTLTLTNTGTAATTAVSTITDPIPNGLTIGTLPAGCSASGQTVTCTVASGLAIGASTSFVIPVTPTISTSNPVVNNASVSGGGDPTCPAATVRCEPSVSVPIVSLILSKTAVLDDTVIAPSGEVNAGDRIAYGFAATNTGGATLTNVTVSDTLLGSLNCSPIASLAPGVTTTFTCTGDVYTLTQADIDNGSVMNTADVNSTEVCTGVNDCTDTETVTLTAAPGLSLNKNSTLDDTVVAPGGVANAGDQITYGFEATNTGNVTLTNVTVSDSLLGSLSCNTLATLAPGATTTITCTNNVYTLTQTDIDNGSVANTADVNSNEVCTDANDCEDTEITSFVLVVDPAISKVGDPLQASIGETVTFTLEVTNQGNTSANGVVITDNLPLIFDVTAVNVSGAPFGTSINVTPPIGTGSGPYSVVVTLGGPLQPNSLVTIEIVTRVNGLGNPPITNTARVTALGDVNLSNNADGVTVRINAPSGIGLPNTGFTPNVVTKLPEQPRESMYASTDLLLEIPSLGVKIPIVGVPATMSGWDVSWLGRKAGWLEGSAFPTWNGNSMLTSHVYDANGLPGSFVNLNKLKYGDKIIVHVYGQKYTFEVRTNQVVGPNDTSAFKHEEKSWLTLITCKEYDQKTNTYKKRVVVRAVLVSVGRE